MTHQMNAEVGCHFLGEYIDEAKMPTNPAAQAGAVVRPKIVADHVDLWCSEDGLKDFTVLLKDGRVVGVRGQCLKLFPDVVNGESSCYGIIARTASEELLIALFKAAEVVGIFHGEMRSDRKIA